ncbi:hypothetical protein [Crocosphaera sp. Alani8]|uniref:hypothetical protein n=1 Tax=Crocosphaera sp. Alani8 TaxID=3038952 RepID=UPI00313B6ED8
MSEREQEIKRLVELLKTIKGKYARIETAESLEKIDAGNPVAIETLACIIHEEKTKPKK